MKRATHISTAMLLATILPAAAQNAGNSGQMQKDIGPTGTMYNGNNTDLKISSPGTAVAANDSANTGSGPTGSGQKGDTGQGTKGTTSATSTAGPSTAAGSTAPTAATGTGVAGTSTGGNAGGGEH